MNESERGVLHGVIDVLRNQFGDDTCYSDDGMTCDDVNKCSVCVGKDSLGELKSILEHEHKGLFFDRTIGDYGELAYHEAWKKINSGDKPLTQHLFGERYISAEDAAKFATIVQWFGTNCGHAFIHEADREAKARSRENDTLDLVYANALYKIEEPYDRIGERIANSFFRIDDKKNDRLKDAVCSAISMAISNEKMNKFTAIRDEAQN